MFAVICKLVTKTTRRCSIAKERIRRCDSLITGRVCLQTLRQTALDDTTRFLNSALSRSS